MALVSEELKVCGIKIVATVSGVSGTGSGVLYLTPNYCDYNYILTAKHIFQEDSQTDFAQNKVNKIELFYNDKGKLKLLEQILKKQVSEKLIAFEDDMVILIVQKNPSIAFKQILVSDQFGDKEKHFIFWSVFKANEHELQKFSLVRSDSERKRFRLAGNYLPEYLSGMSGAGVFLEDKNILYGVISRYPNDAFQNESIDCTLISFQEINEKLVDRRLVPLDTKFSHHKRAVGSEVIDIHQVYINNVCLDLELARKRLTVDLKDDWYHDPLRYIDLLNQDYLFDEFAPYFGKNRYQAHRAETFYVPKKKFTLRLALVSPFLDRIVYMACVGVLAESMDNAMKPNNYSARFDRFNKQQLILNGVEQWKKMRYQIAKSVNKKEGNGKFKYGCIIEIDLLNFYDNISKNLLHEKVLRVCRNENEINAAQLLKSVLSRLSPKDVGLPQNSDASSLLASFYLNQIDVFMFHHVAEYYRFMDDIRILCSDKYEARQLLQTFEYELRRCYLAVNSQKTEIFTLIDKGKAREAEKEKLRDSYMPVFDLQINQVARLRQSENSVNRNEAFHQAIQILKNELAKGNDGNDDIAKRINYAFNTLVYLSIRGISLNNANDDFKKVLNLAIKSLTDKPWVTADVCKVLNLVNRSDLDPFMTDITSLVLDEKYNTYSFQCYHLWLLLAKHKYISEALSKYAIEHVEKNDDTKRPVIAAMLIYLASIDESYRRVILRKLDEQFTHGYFQNRLALVALRGYDTTFFDVKKMHRTLQKAHPHTHKHGHKELVYVPGFEEDDKDGENVEFVDQLYSI
jgi:hypothetical protein